MLRISRLTDYGTMILVYMAGHGPSLCSASDVATGTHLHLPTVQKLLKLLAKSDLVSSVRGAGGGYRLNREPEAISAAEILDALEGPVAITECSTGISQCELEPTCLVGNAWQRINRAIRKAMEDIRLSDLRRPPPQFTMDKILLQDLRVTAAGSPSDPSKIRSE